MNRVIVFKEKHGPRIFDASTPELVRAAKLYVLRQRFDQTWYYRLEPRTGHRTEAAIHQWTSLTDEQRAVLAGTEMEAKAHAALESLRLAEEEAAEHNEWYDRLVATLALPVEEALNLTFKQATRPGRPEVDRNMVDYLYNWVEDSEYEQYDIENVQEAPLA